ncbi:hypothetical protein NI467_00585 [Acinetobacter bohemicus]|uniref:hypothetical protein n=1 Tax=unclassified Acinetobacter TaxID=196816 RepID=UPI001168624B|nr:MULTISPECIES: hypothetical protein [unclassified Acinetobacter]MCO8043875.1 hypothetical protein [Acinetobacter sp. S4397-1]TQR61781.1 hypothetical protein E2K52_11265 [Acinetobacter sp. RF14B]
MAALGTPWQKIQHYFWLVCGICCLLAALIFWSMTDSEELVEIQKQPKSEEEVQIQPEKVASMTHLGALQDEVKPLDLNTRIVVTASHEPEFRGSKYISENKKQYAIELFRVGQEAILKSFLKKQSDRKPFTYVRVSGENQPEQFVLLYGLYKTANEANQALSSLNLSLPKSVQPEVVQMQRYAGLVDGLGSEELNSNQKLYEIRLKNVPLPRVEESIRPKNDASPTTSAGSGTATTSTTVVRRDESGKVVDVKKSESAVENAPRPETNPRPQPQENEIRDPFN